MKILAFDTETTGVDVWHGCLPFFLTTCDNWSKSPLLYWSWEVDPLTRKVCIPPGDLDEVADRINEADELVGQNSKFDILALLAAGLRFRKEWYAKLHDTLFAGHLLATAEPHDLTNMVLRTLRIDIQPLEKVLHDCVIEARGIAKREYKSWRIAKKGDKMLPSLKEKAWKCDFFLPGLVAKAKCLPPEHRFWHALPEYSNVDSSSTLELWLRQKELIQERGLWKMYEMRRKLIPIITSMEEAGITYDTDRMQQMRTQFEEESETSEKICVNLSDGALDFEDKRLPKSGTTKAMRSLMFDKWKMPVIDRSKKTGEPSVDKDVIKVWKDILPDNSKPKTFVIHLAKKRSRDTALSYMNSYERLAVLFGHFKIHRLTRKLHPSYNATGSRTLRFSSSNPNGQNISKLDETNLRWAFGPGPGREWWSLDYSNIELRIPAYTAGEEEMIRLFERPDEGPYFGSQHLLISHILWPAEFEACLKSGEPFNKKYKATLYQWTKNGDFAVTYGAMEKYGTADKAYHQQGAHRKIMARFSKIEGLNQELISYARRHGYVWTREDRECGAYPIQVPRNWSGDIRPTTPLNYMSQGTAMQCMCRAMIRCQEYVDSLVGHKMLMQVHDELVFDFPKGKTPRANLPKVLKLQSLMEESGNDIGIPLRVDYSYHPNNWKEVVDVDAIAV